MYEQIRNLDRKIENIQKWKCENWKINLKEKKNSERFSQKTEANEMKSVKNVRSIEITQSEKQGEKCQSHGNLWIMPISLPYVYMECCQGNTKETVGNKTYLKK